MEKNLRKLWNENKGDYLDLYVQSNKYLLADIFLKYCNIWHKIQELHPARFFIDLQPEKIQE